MSQKVAPQGDDEPRPSETRATPASAGPWAAPAPVPPRAGSKPPAEAAAEPAPGPETTDEPASGPETTDEPASGPETTDEPAPGPETTDEPATEAVPREESAPGPEAEPASEPEAPTEAMPEPAAEPTAVTGPVAEPEPVPAAEPAPVPPAEPEPVPAAEPDLAAVPESVTEPEPVAEPTFEPVAEPVTEPAPVAGSAAGPSVPVESVPAGEPVESALVEDEQAAPPRRFSRAGAYVVGIVALLLVVFAIGGAVLYLTRDKPTTAVAGDCLRSDGIDPGGEGRSRKTSLKIVDCGKPEAKYRVVGRVDDKPEKEANRDSRLCDAYQGTEFIYWEGVSGDNGTVLCLAPNERK